MTTRSPKQTLGIKSDFRASQETIGKVDLMARTRGVKRSVIIREALDQYLESSLTTA